MTNKEKDLVESALAALYRLHNLPIFDTAKSYFITLDAISDLEQALYGENK